MRIALVLFYCVFHLPSSAFSQLSATDEKPRVAVVQMSAVKLADSEIFSDVDQGVTAFAEAATQKVIDAFVSLDRFDVLDRTAVEAILKEQDFQMSDVVNFESGVELGQIKGADIICVGQLQNVSTVAHYKEKQKENDKDSDKEKAAKAVLSGLGGLFGTKPGTTTDNSSGDKELVGYAAVVELQIKITDVSTGSVIMSEDVRGDTKFSQSGLGSLVEHFENSPSKAAFEALNDAKSRIKKELRKAFPVEGKIVEVLRKKKGSEKFLISIGSELGIKEDEKLLVVERTEVEVDGKMFPREKEVGRLKIHKLQPDGYFSSAKAYKNGDDIVKKIEAGVVLIVRTKGN